MDIRPTIIVCIVVLVIIIAIGLMLPNKLKVFKYLCYTLGGLLLIFTLIITPLNIYFNKKEAKYLIGNYSLDVTNSRYNNIDLTKFTSLRLTIKDDYTFAFNHNALFLTDSIGTWLYWVDGDEEIIRCKFRHAKYAYSVIRTDSDFIFESNILNESTSGDRIAFKHR